MIPSIKSDSRSENSWFELNINQYQVYAKPTAINIDLILLVGQSFNSVTRPQISFKYIKLKQIIV